MSRRIDEPGSEIEQRDVVVAGHDEHRNAQAIEKLARGEELAAPRPLGEVTRHGDERRCDRLDGLHQRLDDPRIHAAEVNVGEVRDGRHGIRAGAGQPAAHLDAIDTRAAGATTTSPSVAT